MSLSSVVVVFSSLSFPPFLSVVIYLFAEQEVSERKRINKQVSK